jgi:hypothetical protein
MDYSTDYLKAIANNNPAMLGSYPGMDYNDGYANGIATFRSMDDGVRALVHTARARYKHLRQRTAKDWCSGFTASKPCDLVLYIQKMCQFCCIEAKDFHIQDIRLDDPAHLMRWCAAVICVELGLRPSELSKSQSHPWMAMLAAAVERERA